MANEQKRWSLATAGAIVALISGTIGIATGLKSCYSKPPINHEIDGDWYSELGNDMETLLIATDANGQITGKINQPCERVHSGAGFEINPTTAKFDGKHLHFEFSDGSFEVNATLQDGKLVAFQRHRKEEFAIGSEKYVFGDTNEDFFFTKGTHQCVSSVDATLMRPEEAKLPIEGFWHSAQAELHIRSVHPNGQISATESYPCMERTEASEIDPATTSWDGSTLRYTLPPIKATNWEIEHNLALTFELVKHGDRLVGTRTATDGETDDSVLSRGRKVCDK